jgi:hypothetical protein
MFKVVVHSDKFDWDTIDYSLTVIDSSIIPTVGSTFIHRIKSGQVNENFKFKVADVEYNFSADYFNEYRRPKDENYFVIVYVEPYSLNATYKKISYLLEV